MPRISDLYRERSHCPDGHPLDGIRRRRGKVVGRYCKQCERKRAKAHRATEEGKKNARLREKRYNESGKRRFADIKRKYGLSQDDYEEMLAEQNGRCASCGDDLTSPCVDHCHEIGVVRGILCAGCNAALGHMQDDPDRIMALFLYAMKSKHLKKCITTTAFHR